MTRKKRDFVWIARDGDAPFDCKLFGTTKPPIKSGGGRWFAASRNSVHAYAYLCLRGLASHGVRLKQGECKKVRVKLEVIE